MALIPGFEGRVKDVEPVNEPYYRSKFNLTEARQFMGFEKGYSRVEKVEVKCSLPAEDLQFLEGRMVSAYLFQCGTFWELETASQILSHGNNP